MKLPCRFAVRLPDGSEHTVAVVHMKPDGTVLRIDTHAIEPRNPLRSGWYTIEGDDLELVSLITYTPPAEFDI